MPLVLTYLLALAAGVCFAAAGFVTAPANGLVVSGAVLVAWAWLFSPEAD